MTIITLSEVEQYLWGAANILRGPIDNADFKAYILGTLIRDKEIKKEIEKVQREVEIKKR